MKLTKRVLSFVLGVSMLTTMGLAGCKKNQEIGEQTTSDVTTESTQPPVVNGASDTLVIYPEFDERINRDYLYSVSVSQGNHTAEIPVYDHATDDYMVRNDYDMNANEHRRFSTFAFDKSGGSVRVDIKVNRDFDSYSVLPSAKNFKNEYKDGVISVYLDSPEKFMIRIDGKDSTHLAVFADEPQTVEVGKNTVVIEGWKEVDGGVLELYRDNQTLYIKPGAVLHARVKVTGNNCRIIGQGAILDPASNIYDYNNSDSTLSASGEKNIIYVEDVDNTTIEGVHLLNSYGFNIFVNGSWGASWAENTTVKNVKILSSQLCTDGISFGYYSKNSLAEDCFVYCGDNALVVEENATYRNVMVGTTCNAIFPQSAVIGSLLEDIYVFRADEGIVNQEYEENKGQISGISYKIKNLHAEDVKYAPYMYKVENTSESTQAPLLYNAVESTLSTGESIKGVVFENVYLPRLGGVLMTHFYSNVNNQYVAQTQSYDVAVKNLAIDGEAIGTLDAAHIGAAVSNGVHPAIVYTKDGGFAPAKIAGETTVNYKNSANVFIGKQQIFFKYPVISRDGELMIPYEQLADELYTNAGASSVEEIDGIKYISAESTAASGMVMSANKKESGMYLEPYPYTGNFLKENGAVCSDYLEINPSHTFIHGASDGNGGYVYTLKNTPQASGLSSGSAMGKQVKAEMLKYGVGTYRLTFNAKAKRNGIVNADFRLSKSSAENNIEKTQVQSFEVGVDWKSCTYTVTVTEETLQSDMLLICILLDWGGALTELEIKDLSLVKVN